MAEKIENGFQETQLDWVPSDWGWAQLGQVVDFTRKPSEIDLPKYDAVPFIPMDLVPDDGGPILHYELRRGSAIKSGTFCEPGDILLAKITPSFENGKQGIVPELSPPFAYATTEVFPLRARPQFLDQTFLLHYLRVQRFRTEVAAKMEGSTGRQRVPKAVIEGYPIPLPPLPEQRRIAHVLSTIQRAIQAQDAVIAAARDLKRSLMQRLFTYGPYAEPLPTKETEIGEVPEGWEVGSIGSLVTTTQYGLNELAGAKGTYPMLRMNNVVDGKIEVSDIKYVDLDESTFERFRLSSDDLVFNRTNSYELVGKTGLVGVSAGYVFASYLIRVVPDQSRVVPRFLNYYLNWEPSKARMQKLATRGVSQSNISATKLRSFEIVVPPLAHQRSVATALHAVESKIQHEVSRRKALEALFKSMLHQLMTGQVRVAANEYPFGEVRLAS